MNISKLETQIKRLEKKIKGYHIDFDDPDYAIYKLRENSKSDRYKLDPVNKTAFNRELVYDIGFQKLMVIVGKEAVMQYVGFIIKEIERIKKLPIETNKQIHIDDPHYLIYKYNPKTKSQVFEPYNKAAKDFEKNR